MLNLSAVTDNLILIAFMRRLIMGAALSLLVVISLSGCEDRRALSDLALKEGRVQLRGGRVEAAYEYFALALEYNPLSVSANYEMARLNERYLINNAQATVYYRRFLDLAGSDKRRAQAERSLAYLTDIDAGKIEDPASFIADFAQAVELSDESAFISRVSNNFLALSSARGRSPTTVMRALSELFVGAEYKVVLRELESNIRAVILLELVTGEDYQSARYYALELVRSEQSNHGLWQLSTVSRQSE